MFPAIDAVNQPLFPLDSPSAYTEQGYLQARVFAAREALPIAGATVTVSQRRDGGERLLAAGVTDESGLSPLFPLPAPPRADSESPGVYHPYAEYVVRVSAPGYVPATYDPAVVFSGVTSIQPAELVPLAASLPPEEVE